MKIRLSEILKKSSKSKYRTDFIKYLKSLDFNEFEIIFNHYMSIAIKFLTFYKVEHFQEKTQNIRNEYNIDNKKYVKNKFLSKKWFNDKYFKNKYYDIFNIFMDANRDFVNIISDKIHEKNNKKAKILKEIINIKNTIENLNNLEIPISNESLQLCILINYQIYAKQELDRLLEELNNIK